MSDSRLAKHVRGLTFDFSACASIMLFHFTNYIFYAEYDRLYPDVIIVAGQLGLVAIAFTLALRIPSRLVRALVFATLITILLGDALFEFGTNDDISTRLLMLSATLLAALGIMFFLRDRANLVVLGGSLAMFAATLILGVLSLPADDPAVAPDQRAGLGDAPVVVHIVLDEHIGIAGMPPEIEGGEATAKAVRDFYVSAGFRVFGGAYSPFFRSEHALASALNLDVSADNERYLTRKRYGFNLDRNTYLRSYVERGKPVHIYQSDYLDFCGATGIAPETCLTYRPDRIDSATLAGLPTMERASLLRNMYYSSFAVVKVLRLAAKKADSWLRRQGISAPRLNLWHGRVGPIAAWPTFNRLLRDLSNARGGEVFFAHLLFPHYPYAFNADCSIRSPISTWRLRQETDGSNSAESRKLSYRQYFDQVACVLRRMETLFETMKSAGIYESATIVIHGDHGSRIGVRDPLDHKMAKMTAADYADAFSTPFVLKTPMAAPGTDDHRVPLPRLVEYALKGEERALSQAAKPFVFIAGKGTGFVRYPLPVFPSAETTGGR